MAAANFSRDVLDMFYGPIEENQGKKRKQMHMAENRQARSLLETMQRCFLRRTFAGVFKMGQRISTLFCLLGRSYKSRKYLRAL